MATLRMMSVFALAALLPTIASAQVDMVDLDSSGIGYPSYRIPALAVSNRGTVIAAYDGRSSMADLPSDIDVVVRRSSDGGHIWGPRLVVRADTAPFGFGDPSLLVDRQTSRIFLFYAASINSGFVSSTTGSSDDDPDVLHADLSWSDDDGLTWQHRRLTHAVKRPGWGGLFASSGHGIQIRHGPYAGRLVQQYAVRIDGQNWAVSLVSDDHGESWRMGVPVGPGMDENKVVELADGSLMLNSRSSSYRRVAHSDDGGITWSRPVTDSALIDPGNNAGIVRVDPTATSDQARAHWLLFSNSADSTSRRNLTLRLSCDDGRTWQDGIVLVPGEAEYSTIAMLSGDTVGVLMERDGYRRITFARVPLSAVGSCAN